jgi:hypothetical protein
MEVHMPQFFIEYVADKFSPDSPVIRKEYRTPAAAKAAARRASAKHRYIVYALRYEGVEYTHQIIYHNGYVVGRDGAGFESAA